MVFFLMKTLSVTWYFQGMYAYTSGNITKACEEVNEGTNLIKWNSRNTWMIGKRNNKGFWDCSSDCWTLILFPNSVLINPGKHIVGEKVIRLIFACNYV